MPTKKKLLKKLEREVVKQSKKPEIEDYEKFSGEQIDITKAPVIDVGEELEKEWKEEETEHELKESDEFTNEGMGIEKEEIKGEDPYPEIKKAIKKDADEEEETEEGEEEED